METRQYFKEKGQGHIFAYWDELSEDERKTLLEQCAEVDLEELSVLADTHMKGKACHSDIDFEGLEPAPYTALPEDPGSDAVWQNAKAVGESALREGKVAAFTVAGGQGTRLGYDGPKGTFPVTPVMGKSLFQVFAEKIGAARQRYQCSLPWYIMTSHVNHEATAAFFEDHSFFGLEAGSVRFFKQGRMPAVDFEGRIILESKGSIAMSPDGHGGAFRALERSGAIAEMRDSGVEALSYFQVDNPLVQPIDPYFIGFHFQVGSSMSSKMLPKAYEKEKLGHFCRQDGRLSVVEYSDMPDRLTSLRDKDGLLHYRAGSIAIHILAVDFAGRLASPAQELGLPFHKALKKIPFLAESGRTGKPNEPNGAKFEMFIFDALPFAENPLILETTRLGDFSPVKNAKGIDSPETCKNDQLRLFASWLQSQGVSLAVDGKGVPVHALEIAPSFGYDSETFEESWKTRKPEVSLSKETYIS